ncbi:MAG: peptide chain release factor N(5)-glutamine methyltransferase [Nitrospira sp.]|nr:peptide chain release factor N(5)-glutamine methyltransferase [Nitrospira sp.]
MNRWINLVKRPRGKEIPQILSRHTPLTLLQLLQEGERRFKMAGLPNPCQETDLLVSHAAKLTRLQLYLDLGSAVSARVYKQAKDLFAQRTQGIPIQYLLGTQEFWGLEFIVTPDVLIPRPETENLVEEAISLANSFARNPRCTILDIGTGCGCIAVALSKSLPHARILATDVSARALIIARRNAKRQGVNERITFLKGDLFEPLKKLRLDKMDMIVSNPPYVASGKIQTLAPEVKNHEPRIALDGGSDGLDICKHILHEAPDYLDQGGILAMEIGHKQAVPLAEWIRQRGLPWEVRFKHDLAGIKRVAVLTRK